MLFICLSEYSEANFLRENWVSGGRGVTPGMRSGSSSVPSLLSELVSDSELDVSKMSRRAILNKTEKN